MFDTLPLEFAAALEQTALARGHVGATIHYFAEIGSTNDEAARLAERGAAEGTTVIASSQTAGRGRFGRTWFSPPGAGLYVSVICRDPRAAPSLSLAAGVAVAEGILAATGLPVEIKWPNDIVIDAGLGRRRKLAGILAEASSSPEGVQHVILGFGINLRPAAYPPEIGDRATSLETELGREVQPGPVLAETLAALKTCLDQLSAGNRMRVLARWRELSPSSSGAAVEWDTQSGNRSGKTAGIEDDGALRVTVNGTTERIISGTLRWL
jgi:BirA family biotin operon repressor/biotin-[acetyl-CoA-carboxylase] ligase